MILIVLFAYLLVVLLDFILVSYYYQKINLKITALEEFLFVLPLVNVGALIGLIFCIVTKRHYPEKEDRKKEGRPVNLIAEYHILLNRIERGHTRHTFYSNSEEAVKILVESLMELDNISANYLKDNDKYIIIIDKEEVK